MIRCACICELSPVPDFKIGDRVETVESGVEGVVIRINNNRITIKLKNGRKKTYENHMLYLL